MRYVFTFLLFILFFSSCQKKKEEKNIALNADGQPINTTRDPKYNYNSEGQPIDKNGMVIDTTSVEDIAVKGGKWSYDSQEDKMSGSITKFATVEANEKIFFDSPYDGGSTARLAIRKKKGELDIYVTVKPSQIVFDHNTNLSINVKFDDEKAKAFSISEAADYSSDIFFFNSTSKFLQKLKKSKKVLIECNFYREGTRVLEFNTENLEF